MIYLRSAQLYTLKIVAHSLMLKLGIFVADV